MKLSNTLEKVGAIQKDLQLPDVHITSYYTDKYVLWLDFQTIDGDKLYGLGRRLENTSEGIRLKITKKLDQQVNCLAICIYSMILKIIFQMLSF